MNQEFVNRFMENQDAVAEKFKDKHPSYTDIVRAVLETIYVSYDAPNPEKIHVIDDGDYQGTLLFVIPEDGYQPHDYWYVKIGYGSCSGCDTLEAIRSSYDNYDEDWD